MGWGEVGLGKVGGVGVKLVRWDGGGGGVV